MAWVYVLPLAGYLVLIFILLALIYPQLKIAARSNQKSQFFLLIAALSLLSTWTYMTRYFVWSYQNSGAQSVPLWLKDTSLFKEAWMLVLDGREQWWISQQLCYFTVAPFTLFLCSETQRRKIPNVWVYMLLGQMVAISFAQGLFLAVVASTPIREKDPKRPSTSWALLVQSLCIGSALGFVYTTPTSIPDSFLRNLLVMHLLVFPVLLLTPHVTFLLEDLRLFNYVAAFFLAIQHLRRTGDIAKWQGWRARLASFELLSLWKQEWNVSQSHPALQSISWDVMMTTAGFLIYICMDNKIGLKTKAAFVVVTFLTSIPVTASVYLALSLV
ncbi:hypothetical protein BT69DRAFT_1317760 [Atractiella rhizophila]|nr:hypothetical protein BT69DRAFT_1317760 [Atractiella rhizophila]